MNTPSWKFFISPLSGRSAFVWALLWWVLGAALTVLFWRFFEKTPFLIFFPLAGIVAARSGPLAGILTAVVAVVVVLLRMDTPMDVLPTGLAMLLACGIISYLAYSSRRVGRIAQAQREVIEHDREKLVEVERALRAEAEKANRIKDEFLATLSHELRTPLNAILGWATVIASSKVAPDILQAARVIQRNANAQAEMINDLLDLNRIIAGKLRLELQPVDVAEVINAAMAALQPQIEQKNLRFTKLLDPNVDHVRGDPARIQQIVGNLLSNAIKYTPEGGKVAIALERVNSHIEITVSDTGRGIAPDLLPHIFKRFAQGQSDTKRQGGLGLGLAICHHLAELHGGSIHAKSPGEGQGSTFRVNLPVPMRSESFAPSPQRLHPASAPHPASEAAVKEWQLPRMEGLPVLVVEDNSDARALLTHLLAESGAEVVSAASAPEALQLFARRPAALVVSDIGMPEMDGFEFMRRLREVASTQRVLAVAVTAFARPEDRRTALLSGYDFFVSKPIDPGEFSAILHRALQRLRE